MGTLEQVDKEIKSIKDATFAKYCAKVVFEGDSDITYFNADTKEDLATNIEKAANGREYKAEYYGIVLT